jgi:tetratricopeptide (TPR) repeat protein
MVRHRHESVSLPWFLFVAALVCLVFLVDSLPLSAAEEDMMQPTVDMVDAVKKTVSLVAWVIALAVLIPVAFLVYRKVSGMLHVRNIKSETEQNLEAAEKLEKKGDYSAAGRLYERLGDTKRALALYVQARDYGRAGDVYASLGEYAPALQQYQKARDGLKAAEMHMKLGNYMEAARLFNKKRDFLRAARALEAAGSLLAAARAYGAGGQHLMAAKLFKEEGMFREAAEAYHRSLGGKELRKTTIEKYYTYAALLVLSKNYEQAAEVYRGIVHIDSSYRDVTRKLAAIAAQTAGGPEAPEPQVDDRGIPYEFVDMETAGEQRERVSGEPSSGTGTDEVDMLIQSELERRDGPSEPAPPEESVAPPEESVAPPEESVAPPEESVAPPEESVAPPEESVAPPEESVAPPEESVAPPEESVAPSLKEGERTLRALMQPEGLGPRNSIWVWMEILKTMNGKHLEGVFSGSVPPESIVINTQNKVRIEPLPRVSPDYAAPEVVSGSVPDGKADIYSLGVVLYELLTGSLAHVNEKNPSAVNDQVPEWLDELTMRCLEADREHRFESIDRIYAILLEHKDSL